MRSVMLAIVLEGEFGCDANGARSYRFPSSERSEPRDAALVLDGSNRSTSANQNLKDWMNT
jgi:hypothetical protein